MEEFKCETLSEAAYFSFGRMMLIALNVMIFISVVCIMLSDYILLSDICFYLFSGRYREIMIMIAAFILIPTLKRKAINLKTTIMI